MALKQRRVLGAILAAAAISPACALSDTARTPSAAASQSVMSGMLSKASEVSDGKPTATHASSQTSVQFSTPAEAARARALLDRYYAISADAVAANQSPDVKTGKALPTTPARSRTSAADAFQDVHVASLSTPVRKRFVICGGGTAAWAAVDAIVKADPSAASQILVVTDEKYHPYNRTMLSKECWQTSDTPDGVIEYGYKHVTPDAKVAIMRSAKATRLDVDDKRLELSNGVSVHYDKLLLATGGTPRGASSVSPVLSSPALRDLVSVFRSRDDFDGLRARLAESDRGVVVVGGGFLGTELAIALRTASEHVSLVVAEAGVLYRVLPRYACEVLARRIEKLGITVARSAVVTSATRGVGDVVSVQTTSGNVASVTGGEIVVAVGIEPNVSLAGDAGLETDDVNGGIVVNDFMMAEPDVFAAGDVASFHDRALGRRRVEHWDHAVVTGRIAGENMAGMRSRYGLQSMFWSDLTNIGVNITAVGLVDSTLDTVGIWNTSLPCVEDVPSANEFTSGVLYFVKNSEIVGVVLWNPRKGSGALRRARALVDARTNIKGLSHRMMGDLVNLDDGPFRMNVTTETRPSHMPARPT